MEEADLKDKLRQKKAELAIHVLKLKVYYAILEYAETFKELGQIDGEQIRDESINIVKETLEDIIKQTDLLKRFGNEEYETMKEVLKKQFSREADPDKNDPYVIFCTTAYCSCKHDVVNHGTNCEQCKCDKSFDSLYESWKIEHGVKDDGVLE